MQVATFVLRPTSTYRNAEPRRGDAELQRLLVGSVALSAAGLAVAVVPMPVPVLAVVVVALGLGLGAGQPLTMSWLAEATPPGLRGRAMSLRVTGNRSGRSSCRVPPACSPPERVPVASSPSPLPALPRWASAARRIETPSPADPSIDPTEEHP